MKKLLAPWFLLCFLGFASQAFAIKVVAVKDGLALLDLEGSTVQKGDLFLASDKEGKRRALLQISQIKESKAVSHILKGGLKEDPASYTLAAYTPPVKNTATATATATPARPRKVMRARRSPHAWGVLLGMAQNTMKVNLTGASSVNMKGSGYLLEGLYQRPLDGKVEVLGRFGYNTLKASGTANTTGVCSNGNCSVDIGYLGFDGIIRYAVRKPKTTFWVGGGLGFLFAVTKSSNVLDTGKISTNQKLLLSLGLDWNLDRRAFIPLQFDYAYFPNKNTVTTSQMLFRVGYGVRY